MPAAGSRRWVNNRRVRSADQGRPAAEDRARTRHVQAEWSAERTLQERDLKSEEKQLFSAATLLSIALHALLLYGVMSLPIGLDERSSLFARPRVVEVPVQLARAAEDAYLPEPDEPSILEQITSQQAETAAVKNDAQEALKNLDPAAIVPESEQLEPTQVSADDASPRLLAPKSAGPVEAEPAKVVDLSHKLLAMAQPSIKLPEYKAATDEVSAAEPVKMPIDVLGGIDAAQLKQIDAVLGGIGTSMTGRLVGAEPDLTPSPGGTGAGGTGTGAPGTGAGTAAPGKAAAPMPMPQPVAPKPVPALPPKLPEPPPVAIALPKSNERAVHLDEDFDYELLLYKEPPPKPGLFGIGTPDEPQTPWYEVRITPRRSLHRLKPLNKDVVWVLDTSESISSDWVAAQKLGVNMSLTSLDPGDRFNIVLFKDNVQVLGKNGPLAATPENFEAARRFLAGAESSGYTDVNRALGQLITRGVGPGRVYNIVLASDGVPTRGAVDARAIINSITRENNLTAAIYCVGIGDTIDRKLLEFLAYRNKGYVVYPNTPQKAATAIRELASRTRYPVLKDATFDAIGVDTSAIYPRIPRDVYQGETFSLFGRAPSEADKLSMRITGLSGEQVLDFTFTLPFAQAKAGDEQIAHDWGFWKLHHLYSEIIRQGETKELKEQIEKLRRQYKLKTAY